MGDKPPKTRPHGELARYKWGPSENDEPRKGCRCDRCRAANTRESKWKRLNKARGVPPNMVDAGPVRDHVLALVAAGLGYKRVADMAGVSPDTINVLLRGRPGTGAQPTKRMRTRTAKAILAVRAGQVAPRGEIPAAGTRRRLQALAAVGWPYSRLALRVGVCDRNLERIAVGVAKRVNVKTARAVRDVYDQLWDVDPATAGVRAQWINHTRKTAAARGWAPPAAWDDDEIDDPAAVAHLGERVHRFVALAEDAEELLAQGHELKHLPYRLGVTRKYLDNSRRKAAGRGPALTTAAGEDDG